MELVCSRPTEAARKGREQIQTGHLHTHILKFLRETREKSVVNVKKELKSQNMVKE